MNCELLWPVGKCKQLRYLVGNQGEQKSGTGENGVNDPKAGFTKAHHESAIESLKSQRKTNGGE